MFLGRLSTAFGKKCDGRVIFYQELYIHYILIKYHIIYHISLLK